MISRFNNITQAQTLHYSKQNNNRNNSNSNPNFKGLLSVIGTGATGVLNSLNANPGVGACFLDFFSMVLPRTWIDSTRRLDAGIETGVRESSGTINHAMAGVVGLGAGWLVSAAFNKAQGIKTHFLFTDDKALDVFNAFIQPNKTSNAINEKEYFTSVFKNMKFLNTTTENYKSTGNAFTTMTKETAESAAELMAQVKTKKYGVPKDVMQKVKELIIGQTAAGEVVRLNGVEDSLENHIRNSFSVKQAFNDKIKNDLTKLQNGKAILSDAEFISKIKGLKKYTALAGLAVPVAIGMATQPVNRYLTKKRTGSDGFVGVEGREPDKSTKFKLQKAILGLGVGSLMISTILKNPAELYKPSTFKKAIREIGSALQYKGIVPTLDQFKFIYGMTIFSRLMSVRDKNEMRESTIKDSLGFANWLILGGFVSKIVGKAIGRDTLNYDAKNLDKTGLWNKIKNSYIFKATEKSHEEILYPALKKLGINIQDLAKDGKSVPFRKLVAELKKHKGNDIADKAIKQLNAKNWQQFAGYLYSGLVLGIGITKLNIAITNMVEKKKKTASVSNDKMKISNEFIQKKSIKENKTFGAFLNSL